MSEQLIHELFRGVESVVHERLVIAEDVLQKKQSSELAEMVKIQGYKIDNLSIQLLKLSEQISILTSLKTNQINHPFINVSAPVPVPVPAPAPVPVPAPAPVAVVEPVLKNVTIGPCVSAIDMVEEEVVVEEVVEEEVEEEVVEEEVEEEVVEEEEEEEVVEEEEAQEVELTEFIYKKKTYYRDGENQVYQMDSDGNLDESPIGMWNEQTQRIHPIA